MMKIGIALFFRCFSFLIAEMAGKAGEEEKDVTKVTTILNLQEC